MSESDYWVDVCASCLRASCWWGTFRCDNARMAETTRKRASELRKLGLENPYHYDRAEIARQTGSLPEPSPCRPRMPDANPPAPTLEELEKWLERNAGERERRASRVRTDAADWYLDTRLLAMADKEEREAAYFRACLDVVRERNVGIRCEGCGKAWTDDGESWQSWEDAWTCPACSE